MRLALCLIAFLLPAFADDGQKLLSVDHYVGVHSAVPAISGQMTEIYVREVVLAGMALQMDCRKLDEIVAMPPERTDCTDLFIRTERASQKAHGMKMLQPLAILDVCFAPRYILDVPRIDEEHLDVSLFEDLE